MDFLIAFGALAIIMVIFILIPLIVIPLQRKKKEQEGMESLPEGADSSAYSRFLREKYQEERYGDRMSEDDFQ